MKTELLITKSTSLSQGVRVVSVTTPRTMAELRSLGVRGLPIKDSVSLCGTEGDSRVLKFADGSFAGICETPGFDPVWVSNKDEFQKFADSWD